ncbi:hypothetical protein SMKI_05G1690 [Saccharomyces mikatae IFO 1815]|uniref:Uncharacterized protein n=1 Tax=Saccharomyces mikatae IFO 1815 TaxID=226126 RepID=A0AA35IZU3_SACMI|nr:uncharacterized protein SMKI_05G1690 [Saccharomyces mikatae IFO 1815]CAI4038557.1 hypothetical protein SMKI_05G1690 [Saccharomyces mikatae IFO 1815]
MNFKEPLVDFLKSLLNNINSAFSYRIHLLQLQLLRETNILKVLNRGIEKLFGDKLFNKNPRAQFLSRTVVKNDIVGCKISKYELIEVRAKEIQMNYERMVFEITQELNGDKRVFALITNLSQSFSTERKETRDVKVKHGRPYDKNEIQVLPIRIKPIRLERRARMMKKKETSN